MHAPEADYNFSNGLIYYYNNTNNLDPLVDARLRIALKCGGAYGGWVMKDGGDSCSSS